MRMAPASWMTHADKCYYTQMILISFFVDLTNSVSFNDKEPGIQMTSSQESMSDVKGWKSTAKKKKKDVHCLL